MIAFFQRRNPRPYIHHNAGAFMSENRREQAFRIRTRQCVVISMANAGSFQFDQNLPKFGTFKIDHFDDERFTCFVCNSSFYFHGGSPDSER